jgi:hypothetical protein
VLRIRRGSTDSTSEARRIIESDLCPLSSSHCMYEPPQKRGCSQGRGCSRRITAVRAHSVCYTNAAKGLARPLSPPSISSSFPSPYLLVPSLHHNRLTLPYHTACSHPFTGHEFSPSSFHPPGLVLALTSRLRIRSPHSLLFDLIELLLDIFLHLTVVNIHSKTPNQTVPILLYLVFAPIDHSINPHFELLFWQSRARTVLVHMHTCHPNMLMTFL